MNKKIDTHKIRRIVVKIGSGLLIKDSEMNCSLLRSLADQITVLKKEGLDVLLVSSGAVGCGAKILQKNRNKMTLPQTQAAAAVGQSRLMHAYDDVFRKKDLVTAQVLLTREDLQDRLRYINASNTLNALLKEGVVPVINENDTVAVEELTFGDNDTLGALVSNLVHADLLVILSEVDGLWNYDTNTLVKRVETIDKDILSLVSSQSSKWGKGGMTSKLQAADMICQSGEMMIIANGHEKNILTRIMDGEDLGTLFYRSPGKMSAKKKWIAFAGRHRGTLMVDEGAKEALLKNRRSLLPSGLKAIQGDFKVGDLVEVVSREGVLAKGLVNYTSEDLEKIKGLSTSKIAGILGHKNYDEVISRDNLVVLEG